MPRELDELVDRILVTAVDLGWTPPGWREAESAHDERPPRVWLLECVGDFAYALASRSAPSGSQPALSAGSDACGPGMSS